MNIFHFPGVTSNAVGPNLGPSGPAVSPEVLDSIQYLPQKRKNDGDFFEVGCPMKKADISSHHNTAKVANTSTVSHQLVSTDSRQLLFSEKMVSTVSSGRHTVSDQLRSLEKNGGIVF